MPQPWLNLVAYTPLQLLLFGVGCALWAVCYIDVLVAVRKRRFVEIPALAVLANIAWEFDWSFLLATDMGRLFLWGYRIWFFLDVLIVVAMLKFALERIAKPHVRHFHVHSSLFIAVMWGILLWFMRKQGIDNPTGAVSGYLLNVMMSGLYLHTILVTSRPQDYSVLSAWCKGLGTGLITIFCFLRLPENGFLLTMCATTALLDIGYTGALYYRRAGAPALVLAT